LYVEPVGLLAWAALLIAGCGRVGFDALPPGDSGADSTVMQLGPLTFVQATDAQAPGASNVTATFNTALAAGALVIVAIDYEPGDVIVPFQLIDTLGDTFAYAGDTVGPNLVITSATKELVFGFITYNGGGTEGSTFNLRNAYDGDITEDITAVVPGSYAAIGSATNASDWTAMVATFKGR
jgi:hypothetical protein